VWVLGLLFEWFSASPRPYPSSPTLASNPSPPSPPQVRLFVKGAYERTVALLKEKQHLVEAMAQALLSKEVLNLDAVESILGERPFTSATLQNIDRYRHGADAVDPAAAAAATAAGAAEGPEGGESVEREGGEGEGEGGGGEGGGGGARRRAVDPGMVVAT